MFFWLIQTYIFSSFRPKDIILEPFGFLFEHYYTENMYCKFMEFPNFVFDLADFDIQLPISPEEKPSSAPHLLWLFDQMVRYQCTDRGLTDTRVCSGCCPRLHHQLHRCKNKKKKVAFILDLPKLCIITTNYAHVRERISYQV